MEQKRIVIPFERKAVSQEGEFEGYGSTFGNEDFGGDVIEKGAFMETLSEWKGKGQLPMMPWFHDMKMPVGEWVSMAEDEHGLAVKGQLWLGEKVTEASKMVHNLFTSNGPKGLSIGYSVNESSYEDLKTEDGRMKTIRRIKSLSLFELSPVPFGMNPKALVTDAKSLMKKDGELVTEREVERILRDAGLSNSEAKAFISKGFRALSRDDDSEEAKGILENLKNNISILKG